MDSTSRHTRMLTALAAALLLGCDAGERDAAESAPRLAVSSAPAAGTCEVVEANAPLPLEVRETSGLARSARGADLFWTHNDAGNEPALFAIDGAGRLVQRVRVAGAELVDWEDLEAAACGASDCLYVGDIGDNDAGRDHITVYRLPEPAPGAAESEPVRALRARYPDGPRDAEGLFVDGAGDIFVVGKGRREAVGLYRYPASARADEVATLEHVRELFPRPRNEADRVTAATSTPDRRRVGIRTYRSLYVYPTAALVGAEAVEPAVFDLSSLGEAQGESLVLSDDGSVWLSSEADGEDGRPRWSRLRCRLASSSPTPG